MRVNRAMLTVVSLQIILCASASGRQWHVSQTELPGIRLDTQVRSIGEAVSRLGAGDTVIVHGGVYREQVAVDRSGEPEKPITIRAATGEHVVVTGADRVSEWQKDAGNPGVFSTDWPHEFVSWNEHNTHPSDDYHRVIGRCEQVFVNGYQLHQVLEKDKLSRGTFFVDLDAKRLYAWDHANRDLDSGRLLVEASARENIWTCKGRNVRTKGLVFRCAANRAQQGAVQFLGDDNEVEDCIFEHTNACGAKFTGQRMKIVNCVFRHNGQLGFGVGRAHGMLMTGCTVTNNNTKGYDRGWEAGGNKICLTRNMVVENSVFADNKGNGIWFDIGNEACEVRKCLITGNENAGIFYEISYGLHAHDNVIVGNGFAFCPGAWGANAGISISSSPDCLIERNLLVGNKEGLSLREQKRSTPLIDGGSKPVWNHNVTVRNNVLAYNRDAQVWGWFDVDDERHWPRSMQESTNATKELSLESLALNFEDNLYGPAAGQGLFNWGVTWKRNEKYADLDTVRGQLSFEQRGHVANVTFADLGKLDLRVSADSLAVKMRCYPQKNVPRATLGTYARR